jgi:hypothetical protein
MVKKGIKKINKRGTIVVRNIIAWTPLMSAIRKRPDEACFAKVEMRSKPSSFSATSRQEKSGGPDDMQKITLIKK